MYKALDRDEFNSLLKSGKYVEAVSRLKAMARKGYPGAALHLGWLFEVGEGVESDIEQAERWYQQAGVLGLGEGWFRVAGIHEDRGNFEEAASFYRLGVEQFDHLNCKYNYARLVKEENLQDECGLAKTLLDEAASEGHIMAKRTILLAKIRQTNRPDVMLVSTIGILYLAVRAFWISLTSGVEIDKF